MPDKMQKKLFPDKDKNQSKIDFGLIYVSTFAE
jgi:hypothetical protein